jgi:hypothetical protein
MTILRTIAVFFLSLVFVISLSTFIDFYFIKDVVSKSSVENYIRTDLGPQIVEDRCNEYCATSVIPDCLNICITNSTQQTGEMVSTIVNDMYSNKIAGTSLDSFINFLGKNLFYFLILAIISEIAVFLISENPLKKLGWDITTVGISSAIVGLIPYALSKLIATNIFEVSQIIEHFVPSFSKVLYTGIIMIIIGIILSYASKKVKIRKFI